MTNKLEIKVCGPKGSGKTILMSHIKDMLDQHGIAFQGEICENINTENLTITLSKHDLAYLAEGRK